MLVPVIEAQIPTEEDLMEVDSLQFPPPAGDENARRFNNMTPMIEIPVDIVMERIKLEGLMQAYVLICIIWDLYGCIVHTYVLTYNLCMCSYMKCLQVEGSQLSILFQEIVIFLLEGTRNKSLTYINQQCNEIFRSNISGMILSSQLSTSSEPIFFDDGRTVSLAFNIRDVVSTVISLLYHCICIRMLKLVYLRSWLNF